MNIARPIAVLLSLAFLTLDAAAVTLYNGVAARKIRPIAVPTVPAPSVIAEAHANAWRVQGKAPAASAAAQAAALGGAVGVPGDRSAAGAAAPSQALDAAFDHVAKAVELFHPTLPAGQLPSVVAKVSVRPEGIPGDDDIVARMKLSPLTNPEREAAVIKLYQHAGAAAQTVDVDRAHGPKLDLYDVVQRQDAGRGRHNLIVVKKGSTDRIVVVGAHHDKVHEGAGTIDNWTGTTMLTNLYEAMKDVQSKATFVFVAFSREEEGLIGSQRFLDSLPKAVRQRIDSMVNLDTLGVDGTFSWGNNSTRWLLDRVKEMAQTFKRALKEISFWGGDADSSTFRRAGIPAMTLLGASEAVIWDIIHSPNDTMAAFSLPHYRNAFLLTLDLLKSLAQRPGQFNLGSVKSRR